MKISILFCLAAVLFASLISCSSRLDRTPSSDELKPLILDDDPLIEMYFCGRRSDYQDILKELNAKIDENDFSSWRKAK